MKDANNNAAFAAKYDAGLPFFDDGFQAIHRVLKARSFAPVSASGALTIVHK